MARLALAGEGEERHGARHGGVPRLFPQDNSYYIGHVMSRVEKRRLRGETSPNPELVNFVCFLMVMSEFEAEVLGQERLSGTASV